MTALLWQTALLLLGAYFLGAFAGCLIRRTFFASVPAGPARIQPTAAAAVPPRRLDDPAPLATTAGALADARQPMPAPASRFERALTGEQVGDAPGVQNTASGELRLPALEEYASTPVAAPSSAASPYAPPSDQRTQERGRAVAATTQTERPARSIGTSAAAAAALAAATARHQAVSRSGSEGAERDPHPLPAASGTSGQASTSAPRVHMTATAPRPTAGPAAVSPADDLTRIRANDADLQKRLHLLGGRRFADIAAWKKDDVRRISQALGFRGRIEQENWIEQAQILMNGSETAFSRSRAGMQPLAKPSPDQGEQRPISSVSMQKSPTTKGLPAAVGSSTAAADLHRPVMAVGRDNLQRISRITADIERLLNAQGVSRYDQIAHWSKSDVARFEQLLGNDGRISRENWIEQAYILARGGETAYSREIDREHATVPPRPRPTQLAEAIRAAQAESVAKAGQSQGPGRPASRSVDLNKLRSVRSEAFRSSEPEAASDIGSGPLPAARMDDLKRIRGIGVLIEKRLNSMGYRTYEQLANWTAADVEKVSRALDIRGRIERENWVEQARILASGDQTDFAKRLDRGEVPASR